MKSQKKIIANIISFLFLCLMLQPTQAGDVLSFPGAVGFGRYATGGRGGKVYHVTNLNDSGEGSFRDAVSQPNRIVVFDVSGYITLKTAIQVKSNITIAGQTAPGDGIGIKGGKVSCGSQSNIIIRHLRMRPGSGTASRNDDGINMYRSKNCIIDQCSITFSPWNNVGGSGSNDNKSTDITFQYCLNANPIDQQFGAHIESVNSQWTWYGNCFANTHNRNPLDKVNDVFVNNVLYNYQGGYTTHTSTKFSHDIVCNYFMGGPSSGSTDNTWYQVDKNQSIYYSGNVKDRNKDGVLNGEETIPKCYSGSFTTLSKPWCDLTNTIPTLSAASAYRMVASRCGVQPSDEIDAQVVSNLLSFGKDGKMYTSETQTGLSNDGWGVIKTGDKDEDTDGDGMPDYWEMANGLDIRKDEAMIIGTDGYANIERYINWLADRHARTSCNTPVTIDLSEMCKGWSNISASYGVKDAKNGTVVMNGTRAVFSPVENFYGLGSFVYTVKGNDGTEYSATVSVLVEYGQQMVYENPQLTKQGGGSSSQTINTNTPILDFNYLWENAVTVEVTWEPQFPDGITVVTDNIAKKVYFSGMPTACGSYRFKIVTVGATTTAEKSGTINVIGNRYHYSTTNTSVFWTDVEGWDERQIPYDCDTAEIVSGELNVKEDIRTTTYVDQGAVLRVRDNIAIRELHLLGGTLKSYTSTPQFRVTTNLISVDEDANIVCGSTEASELKLSGKLEGTGSLTKSGMGVLTLNVNGDDYDGEIFLTEGTIQVTQPRGLGRSGVEIGNRTRMVVSTGVTTKNLKVQENAVLQLDAEMTVEYTDLGGTSLKAGSYSKADYPAYIAGEGTLIVTKGVEPLGVAEIYETNNKGITVYSSGNNCVVISDITQRAELIVSNIEGMVVGRLKIGLMTGENIIPINNMIREVEHKGPNFFILQCNTERESESIKMMYNDVY